MADGEKVILEETSNGYMCWAMPQYDDMLHTSVALMGVEVGVNLASYSHLHMAAAIALRSNMADPHAAFLEQAEYAWKNAVLSQIAGDSAEGE